MKMKKMWFLFSGLFLILVVALAGLPNLCLGAEEFKPMTLKFSTYVGGNTWNGELNQYWANEVEKRTGGRIKVKIFWLDSLVKSKDALPGVQSGMTDFAWISSTYHPSNLPLFLMVDNLLNFRQDYVAATLALLETCEKEANLKAEMERENIILVAPHITGSTLATKKCFSSISDLKGKTVRTYGGPRIKYYEYMGMNPVFMPYSDIYEAIDRGTITAFDMGVLLSTGFRHYEVVKCLYMQDIGGVIGSGIFLNLGTFKKFPPDIQKIFLDLRRDYGVYMAQKIQGDEAQYLREWETKYGVTIRYPSPEDRQKILDACHKAQEYIIKKQESEGHAASRKVWDFYTSALKRYEEKKPAK
jgi:TRAP-type C4-dicarboxylate transport system substrate-binding protein